MACIQIGGVTDIPGVSRFNIDEFAVYIGTKDQQYLVWGGNMLLKY